MNVRMGWSGETGSNVWHKVDVELGESDLDRMMLEQGFDPSLHARLPVKVCYQLLQNEAETLLMTKLTGLGYPADKAGARIAVLTASSNEIVNAIKNKLANAA